MLLIFPDSLVSMGLTLLFSHIQAKLGQDNPQTQDSKLEPWRSEVEHVTTRSRKKMHFVPRSIIYVSRFDVLIKSEVSVSWFGPAGWSMEAEPGDPVPGSNPAVVDVLRFTYIQLQ